MNDPLIIIPAKNNSKRCPRKNEYLLPVAMEQLKKLNINFNKVVICAEQEGYINEIAKQYNAKFLLDEKLPKGERGSNLLPLEKAHKIYGDNCPDVILLSPSYPFKSKYMLKSLIDKKRKFNVMASTVGYVQTDHRPLIHETDKCNFKINNGIMGSGENRKDVCLVCDSMMCIDSSILSKYKYHSNIKEFWEMSMVVSKFPIPFFDVDEKIDLNLVKCIYSKMSDFFWNTKEVVNE